MSRSEGLSCRAACGRVMFVLFLTSGLCTPASAVPGLDGLDLDQVSVRELMRLDTEQALQQARSHAPGLNPPVADSPRRVSRSMSGEPRLAAIYGVGRELIAEVVLDHVIYLYRHGQALPVGVAPGDDIYLLHTISSSCVELKRQDESHQLCLRASQWVGK